MRFIPIVGFLILVGLLAFLLITKPDDGDEGMAEPLPKLALTSLQGNAAWSDAVVKGQATVLNFFASWCAPCEAEMPQLVALHQKFPKVKFQGAAWNDEPDAIRQALARTGNPFDGVWIDPKGDATIALGLKGIPETLIIDRRGVVRYRLSGPVTRMIRVNTIEPLLEQLQAEGAHAP